MASDPGPSRLQRSRAKGWRLDQASPDGRPIVQVARPSRWGNPFSLRSAAVRIRAALHHGAASTDDDARARAAVELYAFWLAGAIAEVAPIVALAIDKEILSGRQPPPSLDLIRAELAGKHVMCWCPLDRPCHGDMLLLIAQGGCLRLEPIA